MLLIARGRSEIRDRERSQLGDILRVNYGALEGEKDNDEEDVEAFGQEEDDMC